MYWTQDLINHIRRDAEILNENKVHVAPNKYDTSWSLSNATKEAIKYPVHNV